MAAAVAIGCGDAPCTLDGQIAAYANDVALEDCGDLNSSTSTDPAWATARDCVVAADAARTPFVVRFAYDSIEGRDSYAYVGLVEDGSWRVSMFTRQSSPTGMAREVRRLECSSLEPRSSCSGNLCLACADPVERSTCAID